MVLVPMLVPCLLMVSIGGCFLCKACHGAMPVVAGIGRPPVFGHYQHTVILPTSYISATAPGHSLLM
jgi:hypothetical protein